MVMDLETEITEAKQRISEFIEIKRYEAVRDLSQRYTIKYREVMPLGYKLRETFGIGFNISHYDLVYTGNKMFS